MTVFTITGTVSDGTSTANWTATASSDVITASAAVVPDPAPSGTLRTLTITATSSAGLPLTYSTPVSSGVVFTVVPGSPNKFTFTV